MTANLCLSESRRLRYAAFFVYYVMQGVPAGFALTAVANYLAAHRLGTVEIGSFVAIVGLPWAFQFVWGPVIDRFQSSTFGRRRPWVVLAQGMAIVASLGLVLIRDPATQVWATAVAFFVHSVFASIQDASVDAMAISLIPARERERVNAFMRGGMLCGAGAGAAILSEVLGRWGFRAAALAQTLALVGMTAATAFLRERPGDALLPLRGMRGSASTRPSPGPTIREIFAELFRGLLEPTGLRSFLAIAAVYLASSVYIRALSIELVRDRGWRDTDLSVLTGTSGLLAAMAVVVVGGVLSDRLGFRRMLVVAMAALATFLVGFNSAGGSWSPRVVQGGLMIWYGFDPLLSVAAFPALMAICRPGVEGSQFTAYMAFVNLCDVIGSFVAGGALRWASAPAIGLACGAVVLASLAVVCATGMVAAPRPAAIEP